MILIDALNIRQGGGKVLLDYFVDRLSSKDISFKVLDHDHLLEYKRNHSPGFGFNFNSYTLRKKVLRQATDLYKPATIFCFGNFPMPQKLNGKIKVVTLLQNALLVDTKGLDAFKFSKAIFFKLKKWYFKSVVNNTNYFVVQTPIMKKRFLDKYAFSAEKVLVCPFFNMEKILAVRNETNIAPGKEYFIYPSSSQYHKNHDVLLEAWEILLGKGYKPILKLTLGERDESNRLLDRISTLNKMGARIHNLGFLAVDMLYREIKKCGFLIYPSLEETIGLSLVEATVLGAEVLVSELPYYKPVVSPSLTFNPYSPEDIAEKVIQAIEEDIPETELLINNRIDDLIEFLNSKNDQLVSNQEMNK